MIANLLKSSFLPIFSFLHLEYSSSDESYSKHKLYFGYFLNQLLFDYIVHEVIFNWVFSPFNKNFFILVSKYRDILLFIIFHLED
jgi:hypothetical protein